MNEIFSFHTLIRSFVVTQDLLTFNVEDHRVEIKANNNFLLPLDTYRKRSPLSLCILNK